VISTFDLRHAKPSMQYAISLGLVLLISGLCFAASEVIGYRVVALILLVVVSLLALVFDVMPVVVATAISALIWNFFFIPPLFTFHISDTEDVMMFLLYFIIALVHAILSANIKKAERNSRDKEAQTRTIELYNSLLNSLSHELRTPLATIFSAVDILKENKTEAISTNQTELLEQIDTAAIRLNGQVENLLNMSRLESGQLALHLDWCDINELIYGVLQKLEAKQHTITFKHQPDLPLFQVDEGLLQQAVYNILNNAVTYTPPQTIVEVEAKQTEGGLLISINDNGQGLPADTLPKLFDKFYRAPHSKTGGSGLGLSIVKGFVEAHNGSIGVTLNTKGGLQFIVFIPSPIMHIQHEQS
jgi:two-component system, OmpR family, sensor histidine kinase KdpD